VPDKFSTGIHQMQFLCLALLYCCSFRTTKGNEYEKFYDAGAKIQNNLFVVENSGRTEFITYDEINRIVPQENPLSLEQLVSFGSTDNDDSFNMLSVNEAEEQDDADTIFSAEINESWEIAFEAEGNHVMSKHPFLGCFTKKDHNGVHRSGYTRIMSFISWSNLTSISDQSVPDFLKFADNISNSPIFPLYNKNH